ncbi:ALP1-like protein [Tanacetum coccineum]
MNVLRQSLIFNDLKSGKATEVPFVANEVTYKRGYYLSDGIYEEWSVFIKSISNSGSNDHKRIVYKTAHEASRKDVERAFGVLKSKWKIIKQPARWMTLTKIKDIMYTCVILHNMIIKYNEQTISPRFYSEEQHGDDDPIYAWIGCNSTKFGHLYAAAPTRPNNIVSVSSLLGGTSDNTGAAIARRVVMKTGVPVMLACNIPKDSPLLEAEAEKKLVQKLNALGYTKSRRQGSSS